MNDAAQPWIARHARSTGGRPDSSRLAFRTELIEQRWSELADDPNALKDLIVAPLDAVGYAHVVQPDDPRLAFWLRLSARATIAACELARPSAGPVAIDLGLGGTVMLAPTPRPLVTPVEVGTALYAALVLRDDALKGALAAASLEDLRPPGVEIDEWAVDWARALQGYVSDEPWIRRVLTRAMEGADPAQYEPGSAAEAWCLDIANPEMALMVHTGTDAAQFNRKLADALEAHKNYYGEREFDPPIYQQNDPRGFVALGPLAFACVALDGGWPIEVGSDYLPKSLRATTLSDL